MAGISSGENEMIVEAPNQRWGASAEVTLMKGDDLELVLRSAYADCLRSIANHLKLGGVNREYYFVPARIEPEVIVSGHDVKLVLHCYRQKEGADGG